MEARVANQELYDESVRLYVNFPYCRAIGMRYEGLSEAGPTLSAEYDKRLAGDVSSCAVGAGQLTPLVDIAGALALTAKLDDYQYIATVDLRLDCLSLPKRGKKTMATAQCYRLTPDLGFCRVTCWQYDFQKPFALSTQTYVRTVIPESKREAVIGGIRKYLKELESAGRLS